MSVLPDAVTILVVHPDERAHAPVKQALKAIERPRYEIHWVTSTKAALAALDEHPHDAFLIDRELGGLDLARLVLAHTPNAPVLLLDSCADRDVDLAAAEIGVAEYVTDLDVLEHALRYAISHQHALARLAESEQRYALAMQGANDGLWDWDVRENRLFFSPRWKQMLGYAEAELGDAPGEWLGRVHADDRAALTQALDAHLTGASHHFEHEHRIQHRDGSYRWMLARGMAVRDAQGHALRVVGSQTDVTDRKEAEQRLQHDAMHDALTGLPNRVLFLDRLTSALADVGPGSHVGLLFCDLDRFKQVNDTLGHAAGDELLRQVAARLRAAVRPGDTVGRLSGDEFAIILPALVAPDDVRRLADRVHECFSEPFRLEGSDVEVGTSVGVAVHDDDSYGSAEQLLREADAAMYRAKALGRGRLEVSPAPDRPVPPMALVRQRPSAEADQHPA
jgi:diguanylate cyclase (GGDEF)-like protein/PAS domain S-box-containing protein